MRCKTEHRTDFNVIKLETRNSAVTEKWHDAPHYTTKEAAATVAQALISCHLDYCNSLLYGICDGLLQYLQVVQNAAACPVSGVPLCDHITIVLHQLHSVHWLPICQWILFKIACFVFQSLSNQASTYLHRWRLPPLKYWTQIDASFGLRVILRTFMHFGNRNFPPAAPRVWNDLPVALWALDVTFNLFLT